MAFIFTDLKQSNDEPDVIAGSLMCKCKKCGGTGYGECYEGSYGLDVHPCDDCGGCGDKSEYQRMCNESDKN